MKPCSLRFANRPNLRQRYLHHRTTGQSIWTSKDNSSIFAVIPSNLLYYVIELITMFCLKLDRYNQILLSSSNCIPTHSSRIEQLLHNSDIVWLLQLCLGAKQLKLMLSLVCFLANKIYLSHEKGQQTLINISLQFTHKCTLQ